MKLRGHPMAWPYEWRDLWRERAAIFEHEGGLDRAEAERRAAEHVRVVAETVR